MGRGFVCALGALALAACVGEIGEPGAGSGGKSDDLTVPPLDAGAGGGDGDGAPGDPTDPGNPGDPGDPTDPGDPGDPTDPGDPGDPTDPPPADPFCGDSICTASAGESCVSCPMDCNTSSEVCGNGECQSGQTSANCYADCGPSPWPSEWSTFEEEVVALINMHRAAGTNCPSGSKNPVGPVTMSEPLRRAAQLHSWDQTYSGYFAHASCNGRSFSQRAVAQGTTAFAEVIAGGQSTPAGAVNAWMNSTAGHCDILMSGSYSQVGIGYAREGGRIWTGKFR